MWWTYIHDDILNDGSKVSIRVQFSDSIGALFIDDISVIPKGKRKEKFLSPSISDDYSYRRLNVEDRKKAMLKLFVETVGVEVLNKALEAAWEQLKPSIKETDYQIEY